MLYNLKKSKIGGFTLVEVILVCSVFAIFVSGIILGINRAFTFMNNTRLSVRATNFAREGVEMMYNIRDTNRRKCSGKRDNAWLYIGTGSTTSSDIECEYNNDKLFSGGIYILSEGIIGDNKYIYASGLSIDDDDEFYSSEGFFDSHYDDIRDSTKLTFTGTYKYLSGDTILTGEISELLGEGVNFYRIVRVYGIYKKNVDLPDVDVEGTEKEDGTPAEMRFCVKVFYESNGAKHESELCSIITNFME